MSEFVEEFMSEFASGDTGFPREHWDFSNSDMEEFNSYIPQLPQQGPPSPLKGARAEAGLSEFVSEYDITTAVKIGTIVADPPWPYSDRLPGKGRGAGKHYGLLSMSDIMRFPLPPLAEDCRLYLWTTGPFLFEARKVIEAWGFKVREQQIIWHKTGRIGMGHHVRVNHEIVLIGERGRPPTLARNVRSVFEAKPTKHSAKPDEFYEMVERLSPGPYADLFARRQRPGWLCIGNEVES